MAISNLNNNGPPKELLVFIDLSTGELDDSAKGILSEASRLAGILGINWSVLSLAGSDEGTLTELAPYEVDKITVIEGPRDCTDSVDVQAKLLAAAVIEMRGLLLLLPHNDIGETLSPLIASELGSAIFTEAIAYKNEDDKLKLTRLHLGAQIAESKLWDGNSTLVLTINQQILSTVVLPNMNPGLVEVEHLKPTIPEVPYTTRIIERIPADPRTVDVSEAEVMVSAGLGCDSKGFELVEELTQLLNASLGVTRPMYDLGFTSFERMVGQTGKTVAPRFYLTLGISGSMHHIGGMKNSKRVVSINIDPKAPIFTNSDEGFVADLREVLPLLIERVKSATRGVA